MACQFSVWQRDTIEKEQPQNRTETDTMTNQKKLYSTVVVAAVVVAVDLLWLLLYSLRSTLNYRHRP